MHCGLWNMDHTSWITRAAFFEIAVYLCYLLPERSVEWKTDRGLENTARGREGSTFKPEVLQGGLFTQLCHQIGSRAVYHRKRSNEQTSECLRYYTRTDKKSLVLKSLKNRIMSIYFMLVASSQLRSVKLRFSGVKFRSKFEVVLATKTISTGRCKLFEIRIFYHKLRR